MFKRILARGLLACALALASTSVIAQNHDKVVLLLNWATYSEHAPFYLGRERGYFESEGIDLDIEEGHGSSVTVQAVATGAVGFGYADIPTMIKAAAKGAPVIAVGIALQTTPMSVMGFAEKNIRTPEDIKGKIVAVTPGDSIFQLWPLFLKRNGLKQGDFSQLAGDAQTRFNAVITGEADLLLGYVTDQAINLEAATHKPVRALRFSDYGIDMVSSGLVVQKDFLAANPELVTRFLRAATRSMEDATKDPEAAIDAMLKANPKAGVREIALIGLRQTTALYHGPDNPHDRPLHVGPASMDQTLSLLKEYGGLDKTLAGVPEDYYTNDYLP
jgi:NitT/TauT family transport system substrate-binding protein